MFKISVSYSLNFFFLNGLFEVVQCKFDCNIPITTYSGCSTANILDRSIILSHQNIFTTPTKALDFYWYSANS